MTSREICAELNNELSALYSCFEQGEFNKIRTPFLYPDGDVIDIFCKQNERSTTVTDLGESVRWLRMQTTAPKRSIKQNKLIDDVCKTQGVELFKGMLQTRCREDESLADAVTRVSQAAIRVSDLWFTFRARSVESVTDEVADFLGDISLPFEKRKMFTGRSGAGVMVDFYVRAPERSSMINVLSTGNKSSARPIVNQILRNWYDLSGVSVSQDAPKFISLFDDTSDVWSSEDFSILEELSDVARWSRPDELQELLAA